MQPIFPGNLVITETIEIQSSDPDAFAARVQRWAAAQPEPDITDSPKHGPITRILNMRSRVYRDFGVIPAEFRANEQTVQAYEDMVGYRTFDGTPINVDPALPLGTIVAHDRQGRPLKCIRDVSGWWTRRK